MSFFIEMRCEKRGEGRSPYGGDRCWSDDNDGPGENADDTQSGVAATIRLLVQDAKKCGWKRLRGVGWVCPNCLAHMVENGEHHD
ncbi:hypothetical protein [Pectobacterium parmentieri]|uniref:hypothetical protein n=1 Tax=Pectobacterium parmentieri TaxID=1905730 RepID=UPI000D615A39|nr:hypothetical protein [Pectobacterium parmentieri]PWD66542.1 hypothetical protein DF211_01965 [Pectobacterium parmentieri]